MRPRFHFTSLTGWINDPHGVTYRDGKYHSFFQFVPNSDHWQPNCHWGHAIGDDLFGMNERAVAIAPGDGDDGIWTGSVVNPDPTDPLSARAYYTSVSVPDFGIGRVRVARPIDADWTTWRKEDVVVAGPPPELRVHAFRDPFFFRDGDRRWVLVGAALADEVAAAIAYEIGPDDVWHYAGVAASRPSAERRDVWMGAMWECPQLIRVQPGRYALLTSVWDADVLHYAGYGVGTWSDGRFHATSWRRLSYGPSYYAPSTFVDREGRDCVVFWMREIRAADGSWNGAHSIPFVIEPTGDGIALRIHPDVDRYRVLSPTGWVCDSAAHVEWRSREDDVLLIDIGEPLAVASRKDETVVTYREDTWTIPRLNGSVDVVIDGSVVEVVTEGGIVGFPVAPVKHVRVRGGEEVRVWELRTASR